MKARSFRKMMVIPILLAAVSLTSFRNSANANTKPEMFDRGDADTEYWQRSQQDQLSVNLHLLNTNDDNLTLTCLILPENNSVVTRQMRMPTPGRRPAWIGGTPNTHTQWIFQNRPTIDCQFQQ